MAKNVRNRINEAASFARMGIRTLTDVIGELQKEAEQHHKEYLALQGEFDRYRVTHPS